MANRFLHVGFAFRGKPRILDLEPAFNSLGSDWVRYSSHAWIVWTDLTSANVFHHLQLFIDRDDQLLVAPIIVSESFGILTPWIWGWMASKDPAVAVMLGTTAEEAARQLAEVVSHGVRPPS